MPTPSFRFDDLPTPAMARAIHRFISVVSHLEWWGLDDAVEAELEDFTATRFLRATEWSSLVNAVAFTHGEYDSLQEELEAIERDHQSPTSMRCERRE